MTNLFNFNLENTYAELPETFYQKLRPNPVANPQLVFYNEELGKALGLNNEEMQSDEAIAIYGGNALPPNAIPLAQSYAGHQFGHFTMLGDGRAVLLGEQVTPDSKRFDIQLKGAGRTAYSRGGDGRAALGPMIREYMVSEAMHGLNIPTTRGLAVVTTGEGIRRETILPGAILTRVASSHIRVGTFQFAAHFCEIDELVQLTDYTIERHDPEVKHAENPYLAFLRNVLDRQAQLVAKWQLVGFIHGVMNTDNMTISGETIDYGPCAFMDAYHQDIVFSSIDVNGRYAYRNQPSIAAWNLARFAETLLPLLGRSKEEALKYAQEAISEFGPLYKKYWLEGMRQKLGIFGEREGDEALIEELLTLMQHYHADYTNTFLALTYGKEEDFPLGRMDEFKKWKIKWQERIKIQSETQEASNKLMYEHNPALIPRNKWVEDAIEAAVQKEDYTPAEELIHLLKNPFAHTDEQKEFAKRNYDTGTSYQTFCGT